MLGGRSLSGAQWPPQLAIWRQIDTAGDFEAVYNRYALVRLAYRSNSESVSFDNPQVDLFEVGVAPDHPVLRGMGARYVLAMGDAQHAVEQSGLEVIYKSPNERFSILEIPRDDRAAERTVMTDRPSR